MYGRDRLCSLHKHCDQCHPVYWQSRSLEVESNRYLEHILTAVSMTE